MYFQLRPRLLRVMETKQGQDEDLAAAVALGWRVAELYSLVDDARECSRDTLLPAHAGLAPADHLELQLRAAAGDASRARVTSKPASLTALVALARESADADHLHEAFRERLRVCHVEIDKDLWSVSEALGKAYELGNGLSDTYGRVCRAYRDPEADDADRERAWTDVFDEGRIERLKKLLDDLDSRLDATAVTVVREQLDTWRREVAKRLKAKDVPALEDVRKGLRRQTVIWRQLIVGDKLPEAFLGAEQRARVRDALRSLAWRRYRVWVPPLVLALSGLVFVLPKAAAWYQESLVQSGFASVAIAAIGALGITRASLVLTVRTHLHEWAELLWHRAVVNEVAEATLTIEQVFCRPQVREQPRIVAATARAAGRLRASVTPAATASESEAG
jgi:hypothetical protein